MVFDDLVKVTSDFKEGSLPVLIEPIKSFNKSTETNQLPWQEYVPTIKKVVDEFLLNTGGILFRGFTDGKGDSKFCNAFAQMFGEELLTYDFGSTPRTDLGEGVYTATEYPAHQIIPLHNEQAYTLNWPMRIWFHCVTAPQSGGETPIANSREVYKHIPLAIRERFESKKLLYVRNYGNGLDLPWETVFNTDSKEQVERYCQQNDIGFMWKDDDELRTWQKCQATAQHPITKDWVWFNQAHLFHVSNIEPAAREALLDVVELEDLPRNVYYGDGSEIEESILQEIRGVLDQQTVSFPWQEGDFMMLDNMLSAHGRSSFSGDRKVVVAMARPYTESGSF